MLTLNVLIFVLAIAPSLISAEPIFSPDCGVTMLDKESFKEVMANTVSCVCLFFEAGADTIIRKRLVWLLLFLVAK